MKGFAVQMRAQQCKEGSVTSSVQFAMCNVQWKAWGASSAQVQFIQEINADFSAAALLTLNSSFSIQLVNFSQYDENECIVLSI